MRFLAALFVVVASGSPTWSAEKSCAHCGCTAPCRTVCRLVREEKKVEKICWGVKHEPFCLPDPSEPGCEHCETICQDCEGTDPGQVYVEPKRFLWREWKPSGAKVYTRAKLMKKTVTVKVPVQKWVVEDLCAQCQSTAGDRPAPAAPKEPTPAKGS